MSEYELLCNISAFESGALDKSQQQRLIAELVRQEGQAVYALGGEYGRVLDDMLRAGYIQL